MRNPINSRRHAAGKFGLILLSACLLAAACATGDQATNPAVVSGDGWTRDDLGTAWSLAPAQPMDPKNFKLAPMENQTVFAFCHAAPGEDFKPIYTIRPDLSTRSTLKYGMIGLKKSDYDFSIVDKYHALGIVYMGGVSTTAISRHEFASQAEFEDCAMKDIDGKAVDWSEFLGPDMYRGNIANPAFRQRIIEIAKFQIDGGVDGIHFDEVDDGMLGGPARNWSYNSGFDPYTLADFNAYLLQKYPDFTPADWQRRFAMSAGNYPRPDIPASDLSRNFNYRQYLIDKGFNNSSLDNGPLSPRNPLAAEWGKPMPGRMYRDPSFWGSYLPRYWKKIVDEVRAYAREKYGKAILITNNGIAPYVDFTNIGLWDENVDGPGWTKVDWMPTKNGRLQAGQSLKDNFLYFHRMSQETAPGVKGVLFIDFPTPMLERWFKLPLSQRKDYWRIYGAEAYACGLYWAFPLKETMPGYLDAAQLGMTDFFRDYGNFYRQNAGLYKGASLNPTQAQVSIPQVTSVVQDQPAQNRSVLHLINHNYTTGINKREAFSVAITGLQPPREVSMLSPDRLGSQKLEFAYRDGTLTITVPLLESYNACVIQY